MKDSEIKHWFNEAKVLKIFKEDGCEFCIKGGFKITHYLEDDSYTILDTRLNDFYTEVSETHKKILRENGCLKGTNIIVNSRNIKRRDKYLRGIEDLYSKKTKYKEVVERNKPFYLKKIRNCNENIHKYHDLLQFYKSKVDQFNTKQQIFKQQ